MYFGSLSTRLRRSTRYALPARTEQDEIHFGASNAAVMRDPAHSWQADRGTGARRAGCARQRMRPTHCRTADCGGRLLRDSTDRAIYGSMTSR